MALFPKAKRAAVLKATSRAPRSVTMKVWRVSKPSPDIVRQKRTVVEPGEERTVTKWVQPGKKGALKPCRLPKTKTGVPKPMRQCHVELDWVNEKEAARIGTKPGPHLRFCGGKAKEPAPMVRVKDHREAQELSDDFCACVEKTKNKKQCAIDMAGAFSKRGERRTKKGQAPVFGGDVRGFEGRSRGSTFKYPLAGTLVPPRKLGDG
jgi:hypothetical protein